MRIVEHLSIHAGAKNDILSNMSLFYATARTNEVLDS